MFEDKNAGVQKAAHERMLNDRGRKVIKERMGGNARAFDQYKNMNSNHNDQFD